MNNKDSYETYHASSITLAEGFPVPSDLITLGGYMNTPEDCKAMAFYIVFGEASPEKVTKTQSADIAMLCYVLPILQMIGEKDILKLINMPLQYLARWNQSWEDEDASRGVPSVNDLNAMHEIG